MKRNYEQRRRDLEKLWKHGLKVKQYSPIHWRVWKAGSKLAVDIWPTAGKFMLVGASGASLYTDIVKDVSAKFEPHDDGLQLGIDKLAAFKEELESHLVRIGALKPYLT